MVPQVRLPSSTYERAGDVTPHPATHLKFEEPTAPATELPSWETIVASTNAVVKAAGESLSAAARQFDVKGEIEDLKSTLDSILAASNKIRGQMAELTQQGLTVDQISDELGVIFNGILISLGKTFPLSDQAPSAMERLEMVTTTLDIAKQALLDLARKHGMSQDGLENLRETFGLLVPHIEHLVVITGAPFLVVCIAEFTSDLFLL